MSKMYIPEDYVPALNLKETQIAIKEVKDFFQRQICTSFCHTGIRSE